MQGSFPNRLELDGPNRKTIQKILNTDRKIVAHLFVTSAITVLEREFGFDEFKRQEFHDHLIEEIKKPELERG